MGLRNSDGEAKFLLSIDSYIKLLLYLLKVAVHVCLDHRDYKRIITLYNVMYLVLHRLGLDNVMISIIKVNELLDNNY